MTAYTIPAQRNWFGLILLGLAVGVSSGLFGIGGGIIVLPALVYLFGYYTRIAAGTSLLAVVLPAIVGVISYAIEGNLDLLMAILLATGSIIGAPIGSWLLTVLPQRAVQWGFIAFMVAVIVSLFLVIPSRDAVVEIDWLLGAALIGLGLFTGVMSGLLSSSVRARPHTWVMLSSCAVTTTRPPGWTDVRPHSFPQAVCSP